MDEVNDLMDDIEEQKDIADEISGAMSRPIGFQDFDEVGNFLYNNFIF